MVFRILSTGFLELVAEVEWPDPTRARLWLIFPHYWTVNSQRIF